MSFRIDFVGYDHAKLLQLAGTGDDSTKGAILDVGSRYQAPEETLENAKTLAIQVIDSGFPAKSDSAEGGEHRLAAEWLALAFQLPNGVIASGWRWSAVYDTLHTVLGFGDPIQEIVDCLDEGRPWFGCACDPEAHYGSLTKDECGQVLRQCQKHLAEFEAHEEARHCIGDLVDVFQYGSQIDGNLWYAVS